MTAMSGHQRAVGATDVWLTPREVLDALGPFDLDPCAVTEPRPWPTAAVHYTEADDGLSMPWHGFVWCNPPYSNVRPWLERMAAHSKGIALIFARTETRTFHEFVWQRASCVLFPLGRLSFRRADGQLHRAESQGNAGAPSVFVGYGTEACARLRGQPGAFIDMRSDLSIAPGSRRFHEQLTVFTGATVEL